MADYYSILKKTIASLPESNGAARRSVYSRARNAIVNQLKAYEPPLSPSEITAEQLRLEEAIRKVEAEAAREALGLGTTLAKPQPSEPPVEGVSPQPSASPAPDAKQPTAAPDAGQIAVDTPSAPIPSPLKETLSEAESLGTAANQAVQNATMAVDPSAQPVTASPAPEAVAAPEVPAPDVQPEPQVAEAGGGLGAADPNPDLYADVAPSRAEQPDKADAGRKKKKVGTASDALRGSSSVSDKVLPLAIGGLLLLLVVAAAAYFLMPPTVDAVDNQTETPAPQTATIVQTDPVPSEEPTSEPTANEAAADDSSKNTDRLLGGDPEPEVVAPDALTVTTTTINPQASEEVPAVAPDVASSTPAIVSALPETVSPDQPAAPVAVPADNLSAVAPEPEAVEPSQVGGAQRSILYEEGESAGSAGTAAQGAALWTLANETSNGRQQSVLSTSVEIPERDVKVDIRIKPNSDTSLPASHLVEIEFEFPENFAPGDVVNVPGLVMKPTEEARGDALIGASVKVQPGLFWIALSSLPDERARNLALLRERGWIDIPMLYENGKRGILTIEKGSPGAQVVEQAISAWEAG